MYVITSEYHVHHAPTYEIANGVLEPHHEVPARVDRIVAELVSHPEYEVVGPRPFDHALLSSVHDTEYLQYLRAASREQVVSYPSVAPFRAVASRDLHPLARHAVYFYDTYTPLTPSAVTAAYDAAACAVTGAGLVHRGERAVYVAVRPPGHHAMRRQTGGYCYLGNSALAAEVLRRAGHRVAILDIDIHHGNGTQDIFYDSPDVLTVSLHADPRILFPYFSGFANERGEGAGEGYNLNIPLPSRTGLQEYLPALRHACRQIVRFGADMLVVAAGFDTYGGDPLGVFRLSVHDFRSIAECIAGLHLPTVIVQEGGYNVDALPRCARTFLDGFISGSAVPMNRA